MLLPQITVPCRCADTDVARRCVAAVETAAAVDFNTPPSLGMDFYTNGMSIAVSTPKLDNSIVSNATTITEDDAKSISIAITRRVLKMRRRMLRFSRIATPHIFFIATPPPPQITPPNNQITSQLRIQRCGRQWGRQFGLGEVRMCQSRR